MCLVYLGESGNTGNNLEDPNQPHRVYVGLLVHESQSISVNGEFNALSRRHFGRPAGEPGTPKYLRPSELYQGRGMFTSWPPTRRNQLIQDCLDILIRRESPVIVAYVDKRELAQARAGAESPRALLWENPSEPIISNFLLALNMFIDELNMAGLDPQQLRQSSWPINNFAMVVATDGQSVEPRFMSEFLQTEQGQDSTAVLNNFCFVGPEYSVGTQLAN